MKKILLLSSVLILFAGNVHAGILSNIFGGNDYYYPPNVKYTNGGYYRPSRYSDNYHGRYRYNRYYNPYYNQYPYSNQPVILRSKVNRKSSVCKNEKVVANQFSGIEKLENLILLQTYEYDSAKNRIERLEQKLFGASQDGDLAERLDTLKNVARNYKAYNPNVQDYSAKNSYRPPVFTGTFGSNWRNTLLGNFKNQFAGMPTGITPAMDPAYMDYFEAERAMTGNDQETDIQTNQGYYRSKTNRGAAAGVTILD